LAKRVCVIDIGSNSVRMVVYEKTSRFSFHLLHEAKSKVRISENAYMHNGNLQEAPMQRAFLALQDFMSIANSLKVNKVLCVATSALRDAPNKQEFIQKVRNKLKLGIKVINGEKEAYFGAIACANLLPMQESALSIDIGGGSTEFSFISNKDVSNTLSLDLGTVRLKELYFDKNDIKGAIKYIDKELEKLRVNASTLIGIGGTFRAISHALMKREAYPLPKLHAYEYDIKTLSKIVSKILKADESSLLKIGIEENRFDVIKPGALILQRVLNKIELEHVITSGVGVREGVYLADLLRGSKDKFPNNYNTSVRYIIDSHIQNTNYSNQLSQISKTIFDLTKEYFNLDESFRSDLAIAAKLYPAGGNVHFYSKNKHSYYLIQTALEYGFTHKQMVLISTLARYAKTKLPSDRHVAKYERLLPDKETLYSLSYILSLSIALLTHRPRNIDFTLSFENDILEVNSESSLYLSKDAIAKIHYHKDFKIKF
jgi:exopolyphosphatase/guanosine-5'-triphosphate,3'-diphosphate pyrophosphatase